MSQKDYMEDNIGINDRDDPTEVLFEGPDNKASKASIPIEPMMRDASAQVFDSLKGQSILKNSTIKSKVGYHSTIQDSRMDSPDKRSDTSGGDLSRSRGTRNHRSARSIDKSFISEKSFRMPASYFAMSKKDAATIIQKNYRCYRNRQDFLLVQ